MRRNYKALIGAFVFGGSLFVSPFVSPALVYARDGASGGSGSSDSSSTQNNSETLQKLKDEAKAALEAQKEAAKSAAEQKKLDQQCSRFTGDKLFSGLDGKKNELETKRGERSSDLSTKRGEIDNERDAARSKADSERQQQYDTLMAKATTDAQKAAVEEFKTTVEQAVATRRSAQDAARQAYRDGVDAVLSGQKATIDAGLTDLQAAIESAIEKAKASCLAGTSVDEVKATLESDLKTARDTFKAARESNTGVSDQIKALEETRKAAVQAAVDEFKSTVAAAKTTLELAFEVAPTPTPNI